MVEEESPAAPVIPSFASLRDPRRRTAVDLLGRTAPHRLPTPPSCTAARRAPRPAEYGRPAAPRAARVRAVAGVPGGWPVVGPGAGLPAPAARALVRAVSDALGDTAGVNRVVLRAPRRGRRRGAGVRRRRRRPRSSPGCPPRTSPASSGSASARRSAGCGTTPPAGTRRCWRPASGSSAAPTCGSATPSSGGRRSSTRPCSPATRPPGWDALQPVTATDPALFPLDDPADRLDPVAEHERQQAALAASPERGRLGLLLAAESSGALVAAEMTHAGLPWRADVHDACSPSCSARGRRPAGGRRCSSGCWPRSARRSTPPTSTPTRPASCCARCRPPACR